MNAPQEFEKEKYLLVRSIIDTERATALHDYALARAASGKMAYGDTLLETTLCEYGNPKMETLLEETRPKIAQWTGLNLLPTYSYFRVYKNGDVLRRHRDRPSCEISITINLGYLAPEPWPIFVETPMGTVEASLRASDGLIYRGCDCTHWRERFDGEYLVQVFLHYVDADGPFAYWKYDKRTRLNSCSCVR